MAYISPSVGHELVATLSNCDKQVTRTAHGSVDKEGLVSIVNASLKRDTPPFTVLRTLEHTHEGVHFYSAVLSESHLVFILYPGKDDEEDEVYFDLYSCLGRNHGTETYKALKFALNAKQVSKTKMPVVVGEDVFNNKKRMAKYEKYMLDHSVLSRSKHSMGHISLVMLGVEPGLLRDMHVMEDIYKRAASLDGMSRKIIFQQFPSEIPAATALSVREDLREYEAMNTYPEHNAFQISFCNLDGESVEDKLTYLRNAVKPKDVIIYKEPMKGAKELLLK